jgi:hypothetical protein
MPPSSLENSIRRAPALQAGKQIYQILPEPSQPDQKQQVATKRSKPFFSFLFAFLSQFAEIFRDFHYVSTTVEAKRFLVQIRTDGARAGPNLKP